MKLPRKIKHYLKTLRNKLRTKKIRYQSKYLVTQLEQTLKNITDIPVIVVSYNNGVYVKNICNQLNNFGIKPIVIDNKSSSMETKNILTSLSTGNAAYIIWSNRNFGHEVGFIQPIYDLLPDVFAYTDPDLQFNKELPDDFLTTLARLTIEFPVFKAGFALTIDTDSEFKSTTFHSCHYKPIYFEKTLSIKEFESRYWVNRLQHNRLELYAAPIDTTFAVYRKSNYLGDFHSAIRVAGNFSAIHLPWFTKLDLMNDQEHDIYNKNNKSSNWA